MVSWGLSSASDAINKTHQVLRRMEFSDVQLDQETYDNLLLIYSENKKLSVEESVSGCLSTIKAMKVNGFVITLKSYERVFRSLSNFASNDDNVDSVHNRYADESLNLIDQMLIHTDETDWLSNFESVSTCYLSCISVWHSNI